LGPGKNNHQIMNKPQPKDFGYQESNGFDTESGWMYEGGEEAYSEALEEWNKENRPLTCGPWIEVDGFIYGGKDGDEKVCFIRDVVFTKANKNLICAAPEMLEALEFVFDRLKREGFTIETSEALKEHNEYAQSFLMMNDAIKKAKGE
jgi:hypothetical protein